MQVIESEPDRDDKPEDIHVFPVKGPKHNFTRKCWCEPEQDVFASCLWVHRSVH